MWQARDLIRLAPTFPMAPSTLAWADIKNGRCVDGMRELAEAVRLSPDNTLFLAQLGQAYAVTGSPVKARDVLADLQALARKRYVSPYHLAYVYTGLREFETAIDHLEEAVPTCVPTHGSPRCWRGCVCCSRCLAECCWLSAGRPWLIGRGLPVAGFSSRSCVSARPADPANPRTHADHQEAQDGRS